MFRVEAVRNGKGEAYEAFHGDFDSCMGYIEAHAYQPDSWAVMYYRIASDDDVEKRAKHARKGAANGR